MILNKIKGTPSPFSVNLLKPKNSLFLRKTTELHPYKSSEKVGVEKYTSVNWPNQTPLPADEFFRWTSEMSLVECMRNVMTSEDPKQAVDPKLLGNGYEEQMLLLLKIACFCKKGPTVKMPG
ncbi:unnamed protein product [Lactuca virosa]|uniref:Uncharacterized protein n=1 Tax=Lactuca virosa TaxID=75947 RepID=A0AAU9NIR4_9ASTR|nr:unnamed protein product [Lactuca virosa]